MENIPQEQKQILYKNCFVTNNNFAYKIETNDNPDSELKIFNFVPTYDPWCLGCSNKSSKYKCSKCKSVYFCSTNCQKKCWSIHKKHCGQNIFGYCISCCKPASTNNKCQNCPVRFCSDKCKNEIYNSHIDYDCKYFAKTFGKNYLDYK